MRAHRFFQKYQIWCLSILVFLSITVSSVYCFDEYNPKQVITHLWRLPLDQCNQAWRELVTFYCQRSDQLMHFPTITKFVRLCRMVHNFLIKVYADVDSNALIYCEQYVPIGMDSNRLCPLLLYWKSRQVSAYQDFYALYFDSVGHLFVRAVYEASCSKCTQHSDVLAKVERYYSELQTILSVLATSSFEDCYARQLVRYQSLVSLVRSELVQEKL